LPGRRVASSGQASPSWRLTRLFVSRLVAYPR
jgi:hypothetical protein